MFKKMKEKWHEESEVMDKVLKELNDLSKWIYDNNVTYKHVDSDLVIKWGYMAPIKMKISLSTIYNPVHRSIPKWV